MALEQQIQKDIMAAMKAKDTVRLNAVRSIKSAILLAKTAEGASGELTDGDIVKLIQKLAKQRKKRPSSMLPQAARSLRTTRMPKPPCWPGTSQSSSPPMRSRQSSGRS